MALHHNTKIVTDGLVLAYDPANYNCYHENIVTQSQSFSGWASGTTTITTDLGGAPDGTTTSSFIAEAADTGQHLVGFNTGTVVIGSTYTMSVYAKAATRTQISLTAYGEGYSVFNLSAGTVVQTGGNTCTIINVGNGWYRCTATITKTNTNGSFYVLLWNGSNVYAGTAGYGCYIWGAQVNEGTGAAPYSPTTLVAQAKRVTDLTGASGNATITGSPTISSLGNTSLSFPTTPNTYLAATPALSASVVTASAWVKVDGHGNYHRFINNGWVGNGWLLFADSTSWAFGVAQSSTQHNATYAHSSSTAWTHLVGTYDGSNVKLYVNGTLQSTQSLVAASLTVGAINIGVDSAPEANTKYIGHTSIYNRALTDTEVAQNFNALRSRYGV